MKNIILVLDFGSQYTQLIVRRIRELGVYCELLPYHIEEEKIRALNPKGIILSGGPETVTENFTPRAPSIVFKLGCPVLGICYGMQTMAVQLGGKVTNAAHREFGFAKVEIHGHSLLLNHIEDSISTTGTSLLDVWMSHQDHVTQLPDGFEIIAKTDSIPIAGMANESLHLYGVQFHLEVTHTQQGQRILQRFVHDICAAEANWNSQNILHELTATIQQQVGNDEVILGLSGGVDSSVLATLLHQTIGKNLKCLFVDHGLLRLHEKENVMALFANHLGIEVICIDAEEQFLKALAGATDPEQKRKIIGREFIEVFEQNMQNFPRAKWLAQGTIYPDVIESAGNANSQAHVIKSHHNVGGLPENLKLKLLEPLRLLFKDEVRKLGLELGLPHEMIYRHPFPGPGLAVRILGEIKKASIDIVRQADHIFIEELHKHHLYSQVSQAFTVFLPVNSVGVMGDARKYEPVVALRAVETTDFMTAHFAKLPWDFLEKTANRIINEVAGISRVVYDVSGKPPATIEWE